MLRLCFAAVLVSSGCLNPQAPAQAPPTAPASVEPDAPARLGVGESATIAGVAVRFVEVTEDSRCPQGVTCVWEGRAHVRLVVAEAPVVLTAPHGGLETADEPQSVVVGETRIRLLAVDPFPGSAESEAGAPVQVVLTAEASGK